MTTQPNKIIKWESYKNHIDNLVKSSKEISKEILPQMGSLVRYRRHDFPLGPEAEEDVEDFEDDIEDMGDDDGMLNFLLPKSVMQDIAMIINHDCWIGHTNFDITEDIAEKLNVASGVELLKIVGRYQFVIGLGKCFDFTEVRSNIYSLLEITSNEKS